MIGDLKHRLVCLQSIAGHPLTEKVRVRASAEALIASAQTVMAEQQADSEHVIRTARQIVKAIDGGVVATRTNEMKMK